jgi:hypothetical protein
MGTAWVRRGYSGGTSGVLRGTIGVLGYSGGTQKTQAVVDVLWTGYLGVYTRTSHPFSWKETYISASARSSRAHTHTHTPMHPRTARISDLHPCRSLSVVGYISESAEAIVQIRMFRLSLSTRVCAFVCACACVSVGDCSCACVTHKQSPVFACVCVFVCVRMRLWWCGVLCMRL